MEYFQNKSVNARHIFLNFCSLIEPMYIFPISLFPQKVHGNDVRILRNAYGLLPYRNRMSYPKHLMTKIGFFSERLYAYLKQSPTQEKSFLKNSQN